MHNASWDNTHGKLQLVKNPFGKYLTSFFAFLVEYVYFVTSIMLQDGPASPVKMAKKVPVKKPVPVMSESEEVNSFQILVLFQRLGKLRIIQKFLHFLNNHPPRASTRLPPPTVRTTKFEILPLLFLVLEHDK